MGHGDRQHSNGSGQAQLQPSQITGVQPSCLRTYLTLAVRMHHSILLTTHQSYTKPRSTPHQPMVHVPASSAHVHWQPHPQARALAEWAPVSLKKPTPHPHTHRHAQHRHTPALHMHACHIPPHRRLPRQPPHHQVHSCCLRRWPAVLPPLRCAALYWLSCRLLCTAGSALSWPGSSCPGSAPHPWQPPR